MFAIFGIETSRWPAHRLDLAGGRGRPNLHPVKTAENWAGNRSI